MRQTSQAYAKAAFNQALQDNALDAWYKLIQCLSSIQHPMLKSPHLTDSLMVGVISDSIPLTDTQEKWLRLLVKHRHIRLLSRVCERFNALYRKHEGIHTIIVTTARELSSEEKLNIQKCIKQKADVTFSTNPDIIGGVQIEHDGVLIDHSYNHILNQLHRKK